MVKIAHIALLLMFALFAGIFLLFSGEHIFRVVLMLGGMVLLLARGNAIVDRGRRRIGKPEELVSRPLDILALNRRDWVELVITGAVGIGLCMAGLVAFRGGA